MTILSRLRKKYSKNKGVIDHSFLYFEMKYLKYGKELYVCFIAPSPQGAKIKAKSIMHTLNGEKILDVRKLDIKNLGESLTWNCSGIAYSQYQSKRHSVYKKENK